MIPENLPQYNLKHGTRSKYTFHKCRCLRCKEANSKYKREWTRKYRAEGRDTWYNNMMEDLRKKRIQRNGKMHGWFRLSVRVFGRTFTIGK